MQRPTLMALLLIAMTFTGCASLPGSNNSSAQTWALNFQGQIAYVAVTPFTNSGTFSETSNSPGVYITNPDGTCKYRLPIGGTIAHNGANDSWMFQGVAGAGCNGMQTMVSGGGTANGAYPNATAVGGMITATTQLPGMPTNTGSYSWSGQKQ